MQSVRVFVCGVFGWICVCLVLLLFDVRFTLMDASIFCRFCSMQNDDSVCSIRLQLCSENYAFECADENARTTMHNIRKHTCVPNFTFSEPRTTNNDSYDRNEDAVWDEIFHKECDAVSVFGANKNCKMQNIVPTHSEHHRIINNGFVCNNNLNKSCLHFR